MESQRIQGKPRQPSQVKQPWSSEDAGLGDYVNKCNLKQNTVDNGGGRSEAPEAMDQGCNIEADSEPQCQHSYV